MKSLIERGLLFVSVFLLLSCSGGQDSFVEDNGKLLSEQQLTRLESYHQTLLEQLDVHFKVISLDKKADDIDELAAELFGKLGQKTSAAKGLLFLVDPIGEKVRIEVGYDLEDVYPDGFVGYLEEKQMQPFFELGKIGQGLEATGELLVARLIRYQDGQLFDAKLELGEQQYYSGGGGAKIDVKMGAGTLKKDSVENPEAFLPGSTPEQTLQRYRQVLALHIKDPNLGLYTPQTKKFFSNWVVTDGQQNNELRSLQNHPEYHILIDRNRAVIRYPVAERLLPPYFMELGDDGWMLDFWTMSQTIRMNHKNQWHLVKNKHPYMFGFVGWRFDKNGFPHENK